MWMFLHDANVIFLGSNNIIIVRFLSSLATRYVDRCCLRRVYRHNTTTTRTLRMDVQFNGNNSKTYLRSKVQLPHEIIFTIHTLHIIYGHQRKQITHFPAISEASYPFISSSTYVTRTWCTYQITDALSKSTIRQVYMWPKVSSSMSGKSEVSKEQNVFNKYDLFIYLLLLKKKVDTIRFHCSSSLKLEFYRVGLSKLFGTIHVGTLF